MYLCNKLSIYGHNSVKTILKNSYIPILYMSCIYLANKKPQLEPSPVKLLKYEEDNSLSSLENQIKSLKAEEENQLIYIGKHHTYHYIPLFIAWLLCSP